MRAVVVLAAVVAVAAGSAAGSRGAQPQVAPRFPPPKGIATNHYPVWSPDGRRIAWAQLDGTALQRIWIAAADGSRAHPVGRAIDSLGQVAWLSRDALMYWANFRLFRVTTSGRRSLVAGVAGGEFSLDRRGRRVAVGAARCPLCGGGIVTYDPASGAVVGRVGGKNEEDLFPSLSPNSRRVAYARLGWEEGAREYGRDTGIWVGPTRGGASKQIATTGTCPRWSPDGRTVAYIEPKGSLLLVPATGGAATELIREVVCNPEALPAWSPNGRRLAVAQGRARLRIIDVAAHRIRVVPKLALWRVTGFSWAPSSRALLVAASTTAMGCASLWRVEARTLSARLLRHC